MEKFLVPFVLGAAVFGFMIKYIPGGVMEQSERLQKACEASIPRTQKCVMQYIPEPVKPAHTLK
jgi:hypothetical protein